ncbi:MFS transporter [Sphingomonas sp. AP4-R1]|uniref:MFS transporter n=1 Tax=Sphingomonas sp. AP4-R1 TaxID=2735134 RepID=UPI0014936968|nr:MFS transporter [Sphingomonas sp. AP4-R1]QJU58299.1 MFS transporter [Sphingomonas sp. AP4-R1]
MATGTVHGMTATRRRFGVMGLLFVTVLVNYLDRTNISIAAPRMRDDFHLTPHMMGWIFSSWGWAYAVCQIAGGWLADKVRPRLLAAVLIFTWSCATLCLGLTTSFAALIVLRFLVGALEAPSYPINSRVVTTWFPEREKGAAVGIFGSAQFVGIAFLNPLLTWMLVRFGWQSVFLFTGMLGMAWAVAWFLLYREPRDAPRINQAELDLIRNGGGIPDLSEQLERVDGDRLGFRWRHLGFLLSRRKLWGLYLGQIGLGGTTMFFLTWFPTYLVDYRGMSFINAGFAASVPFLCGFVGVLCGGFFSDFLLRRGFSIGVARKTPIVGGMILSTTIIGANFVEDSRLVILFMAIAFFGTGFASIVWSLVSALAPKRLLGLTGGVFNTAGGIAGILVPLCIGYLADGKNFAPALVFVTCLTVMGALSYGLLTGKIERIAYDG